MLFNILLKVLLFSTSLSATLAVASSHFYRDAHRHSGIATRAAAGALNLTQRDSKFSNARLTFYDAGMGACGKGNVASDFIVALNSNQYVDGHCFEPITISYGGKTAQATVVDECPGCPYAGLDCSRGLFDYFASEDDGVISATWWFGTTDEGNNDAEAYHGQGGGGSKKKKTKHTSPATKNNNWGSQMPAVPKHKKGKGNK